MHIGYQVFGEGSYDLVLNDGWMSNVDAGWDMPDFAAFLRALARRARVITFDRRGFGISDRPPSQEAMALEKSMDDLRTVMDAVGSERAVISGLEAGGAVSLLFAASFPDRTAGLVLVAPLVSYWKAPGFPWGLTQQEADEWVERIERSWGTEEFWRWNLEEMGMALDDATLRAWAKWSRLCASPQAALAIEQVERQVDVRALLPQIRVPTLVMLKAGDRDDSVWGAAPWVAEQIPGARYVELPGGGHFPEAGDSMYFDELDRFVSQIHAQEAEFDRVLATVLFTDIVNSTDTAARIGDRAWRDLVERHHGIVRAMIARYRGVEVDTAGDGFFATFDGPARGALCAADRRGGSSPRTGGARRRAHRRSADDRWEGWRVGRRDRCARWLEGRSIRSARVADGEGPHRGLGTRPRGCRRARAQGCPGPLASLPGGRRQERGSSEPVATEPSRWVVPGGAARWPELWKPICYSPTRGTPTGPRAAGRRARRCARRPG